MAHAERCEVGHRTFIRPRHRRPRGLELGNPDLPGRERRLHPRALLAELQLGQTGAGGSSRRAREDVEAKPPLPTRIECDPVADATRVDLAALREEDLRRAVEAVGAPEHEAVPLLLVVGLDRWRERPGMARISHREVVLLDGEDVREIRPDFEPELELDPAVGMVSDDDVILHPLPDEALSRD